MVRMHRLSFEVSDEDMPSLRQLARADHRPLRDQASWYLHLKIQEELAKLQESEPVAEVA